ncbi:MAG: hypothetical protein ACYC5O_09585 [Anaerolineae bacterium]
MKRAKPGSCHFFVDEAGDPTFYDRDGSLIVGNEGCSRILILGFVQTEAPEAIRRAVMSLQADVAQDPYFREIPSVGRTRMAFHAKDDTPEVRYLVYRLLSSLEFSAQLVVARKIERVFRSNFRAEERQFYDHLVSRLFENVLHRHEQNRIVFSKRGSRDRQAPLKQAISAGVHRFEARWHRSVSTTTEVQAQSPTGEPCLSVIDYVTWAVYRAFTRGEMRYYRAIGDKVSLLVDLYDTGKYPGNYYSRRNPFDISKATPL